MPRSIYHCTDYNGHKDVLFFMEDDDASMRNGLAEHEHYTLVSTVTNDTRQYHVQYPQRLGCFYVWADDGHRYRVYPDYSVKRMALV